MRLIEITEMQFEIQCCILTRWVVQGRYGPAERGVPGIRSLQLPLSPHVVDHGVMEIECRIGRRSILVLHAQTDRPMTRAVQPKNGSVSNGALHDLLEAFDILSREQVIDYACAVVGSCKVTVQVPRDAAWLVL